MKLKGIILKSLREQVRSYWLLLLSLIMGPFFIFVYFLIVESSKSYYDITIQNSDAGAFTQQDTVNLGAQLIDFFKDNEEAHATFPVRITQVFSKETATDALNKGKSHIFIEIPENFTTQLQAITNGDPSVSARVHFTGDLTNTNYLISAVWANELLLDFTLKHTHNKRLIFVEETALGSSGETDTFTQVVPGILVISLIMLMFTASIAFVSEVENKTILRLKLTRMSALEYLAGVGSVQLLVGIVSMLLTLLTAIALGFQYQGSLGIMILIGALTSISIIAFSLVISAFTRSANEVLIVGNFPMFLFMFFTGAAFPLKSEPLFSLAGYPVSVQGLMTPVHAISALNKTLVVNLGFQEIIPELVAITVLTLIYFFIGAVFFHFRHLKLK